MDRVVPDNENDLINPCEETNLERGLGGEHAEHKRRTRRCF